MQGLKYVQELPLVYVRVLLQPRAMQHCFKLYSCWSQFSSSIYQTMIDALCHINLIQ